MVVYCLGCNEPNMGLPIEGMFCSSDCKYNYDRKERQRLKKKEMKKQLYQMKEDIQEMKEDIQILKNNQNDINKQLLLILETINKK
jgi:TolA-binding protein